MSSDSANPKRIDANALRGDSGIALIHTRVNQMDYVWHERKIDAGIDGMIEVRDPVSGAMSNRHLLVQSKASSNPFPGETDETFYYRCDPRDVDYWLKADAPVLLVCSHPDDGQAWWMHVQAWFRDTAHKAAGRIYFDKATQALDQNAADRLASLVDPQGRALTVGPSPQAEALLTNLLPVGVPSRVWIAPTDLSRPRDVFDLLRERSITPGRSAFVIHDRHLISFDDPVETKLDVATKGIAAQLASRDFIARYGERPFVQLLNRTLIADLAPECRFHSARNVLMFAATPDLTERTVPGVGTRTRKVFYPKAGASGQVSYYKHVALSWQFQQLDEEWFIALEPDYHFTRDGYRDSNFIADLLSGAKRLDRNAAVRGHLTMWARHLRRKAESADPDSPARVLKFGPPVELASPVSVPDAAWIEASHDEPEDVDGDADDLLVEPS